MLYLSDLSGSHRRAGQDTQGSVWQGKAGRCWTYGQGGVGVATAHSCLSCLSFMSLSLPVKWVRAHALLN